MGELTQKDIDELQSEAKKEWQRMLNESGKSPGLLIATDHDAVIFHYDWQLAKEMAEGKGLHMDGPPPEIKVTFHD